MNKISFKILAASFALLLSPALFAQEQEMPSADEMAIMEVEVLEEELELDAAQIFLADSVLRHNYQALMDEFEKMKTSGMQSTNSYKAVSDKWMQKCKDAFQLFLDNNNACNTAYIRLRDRIRSKGDARADCRLHKPHADKAAQHKARARKHEKRRSRVCCDISRRYVQHARRRDIRRHRNFAAAVSKKSERAGSR